VDRAPDAEVLAPGGRCAPGIETALAGGQPLLRLADAIGGDERFARRQLGERRLGRRDPRGPNQLLGHRQRFVVRAPPDRHLDAEDLGSPFVPPHDLGAIRPEGLARLAKVVGGALVGAAHQVDLRKRVEDGAGGLAKLNGTAQVERAREDLLGPLEIAELHEDLAKRRQRDRQSVPRTERLVNGDAALGKRERLIVMMAEERDVRLIVDDAGEHIVGLNGHREPLALSKGGRRFVAPARLREQHGGQRMHQRQVAPVAGGVQR
jgi:hypothetical protein